MAIRRLLGLMLVLLATGAAADSLRFSLIRTGESTTGGEFAWRDGRWVDPPRINHVAVLIEHSGRRLLFGTGLGKQIDVQMDSAFPWREKRYVAVHPARDQLSGDDRHVDQIVLGCARWQYASGLADFAELPVLASQDGIDYARTAMPPAVLAAQFAHGVNWQPLRFEQRPFLGFTESLDLSGDQRLVLVKLPGHGALGLFLTMDDGRRFFLRGDAAEAAQNHMQLPEDTVRLHDTGVQERLGFYPHWTR
ncbi:Zn-dependent hydrolase [Stutzerimonas stutzeri]|uniref:Zn-dependent hydrolase n=1 Tax=Stutzerimonas stutzeri TaxID=316 RepID=UPI00210EDC30|nr:Zn-dependent hydrolase [Stutzerimonas stutzeri]MCQ4257700.1 Zn-dependent hydrolase [Stutzerimonas stutzeri]